MTAKNFVNCSQHISKPGGVDRPVASSFLVSKAVQEIYKQIMTNRAVLCRQIGTMSYKTPRTNAGMRAHSWLHNLWKEILCIPWSVAVQCLMTIA